MVEQLGLWGVNTNTLSLVANLPGFNIINRKKEVPRENKAESKIKFRIPLLRIIKYSSESPVEMLCLSISCSRSLGRLAFLS